MSGHRVYLKCGCNTSYDYDHGYGEYSGDKNLQETIKVINQALYNEKTKEERNIRLEYQEKSDSIRLLTIVLILSFPVALMICVLLKSIVGFVICSVSYILIMNIGFYYLNYYYNKSKEKLNEFLKDC